MLQQELERHVLSRVSCRWMLTLSKTNVAMLTILNEIGKWRDESTGSINLDAFKIAYVAPMKFSYRRWLGTLTRASAHLV